MDFYYRKNIVGIIEKVEDDILLYEPCRCIGHYELMEDLRFSKECECEMETGEKILITGTAGYAKLKIKAD
jgi:hypothetical protein